MSAADDRGRRPDAAAWLFPEPDTLRRLERMTVAAKGRARGTTQGKRRSRTLGSSLEFADYRPYAPGDDIRRLDWNVYGRTGRAYIRQFWDEQEIPIQLYIDVSRSMRFGAGERGVREAPPTNKLAYALRLAAGVGYAGLSGEDRVGAVCFAEGVASRLPAVRGKAAAARLFAFLADAAAEAEQVPTGSGDLAAALLAPGALPRLPGQTWLFTDALFERGLAEALNGLLAAGQEVVFVHIMAPEELRPALAGERKLIDAESGLGKEVALGSRVLAAYREAVDAHCAEVRRLCAERGFAYAFADTSVPAGQYALRELLARGLLKS